MAALISSPNCQWPNWLNLILAIWLFISPWVIGFAFGPAGTGAASANGAATVNNVASTAAWDAWIVAVIVAVLSIAAISRLAVWEEWVNPRRRSMAALLALDPGLCRAARGDVEQ